MSRPGRRTLNPLLAAFVLLAGLPRLEWRHLHEGGDAPHRHAERVPHDSHHHPSEPLAQHSRHHGDDDRDAEAVRLEIAPFPASVQFASVEAEREWHVHRAWLGGLAGDDWGMPGGGDDSTIDDTLTHRFVVSGDRTNPASWAARLALLNYSHGPPWWLASAWASTSLLRTAPDLGPSPPLCDRARHERSGVLLT